MKLTWFGDTTLRIHAGGAILVVDAAAAPAGIDAAELVSGADTVIADFGAALPPADPKRWSPRRPQRLLDSGDMPLAPESWSLGPGTVLVDASGEAPLLLLAAAAPSLGRWAEQAVICLFGRADRLIAQGLAILGDRSPRLLALAAEEPAVDIAIAALRPHLGDTGLVALEVGLALEV